MSYKSEYIWVTLIFFDRLKRSILHINDAKDIFVNGNSPLISFRNDTIIYSLGNSRVIKYTAGKRLQHKYGYPQLMSTILLVVIVGRETGLISLYHNMARIAFTNPL